MSGEVQAAAVLGGLSESEEVEDRRRRQRPRGRRLGLGDWLLPVYVTLAFIFLLIPIVYTFVFSFNDSIKSNIAWRGFTFDKWLNVCNVEGGAVCEAFGNSIVIGLVATVVATTLGTMIAIALVRYRFRARSATSLLLFLPMATPEVVLGAGLAAQFLAVGVPKDMLTIILAHTMFCISFVVVTVKARVASLDPALEEAGRDLYGSPSQVFWQSSPFLPCLRTSRTTQIPVSSSKSSLRHVACSPAHSRLSVQVAPALSSPTYIPTHAST